MSELKDLAEKYLEAEKEYNKSKESDAYYRRNAAFSAFAKAWYDEYEMSLCSFRAAREAAVEIGCEI